MDEHTFKENTLYDNHTVPVSVSQSPQHNWGGMVLTKTSLVEGDIQSNNPLLQSWFNLFTQVTVPCRNRRLFYRLFLSPHWVWSACHWTSLIKGRVHMCFVDLLNIHTSTKHIYQPHCNWNMWWNNLNLCMELPHMHVTCYTCTMISWCKAVIQKWLAYKHWFNIQWRIAKAW